MGLQLGLGLGLTRRGGGGGFDFFVDSVNGSDSNDGLTAETAFQTLSAASAAMSAGKKLALLKGSTWREQFTITWDNITLGVTGTGAAPVINAADVVTATWTQPDAVTYPDVWSISWTRSHAPSATDQLLLWADGVLQTHRGSLADLQSLGGWRADNRTAQTTNVYIKSTVDPNSSGVVYELPKRANALRAHSQLLGVSAGENATITGPIEMLRSGQNYGPLAGGSGSQSRILSRDGGLHHVVSEAPTGEDIICTGVDPSYPITPAPFTAYRALSTGFSPTWKRVFVVSDARASNSASAIYAHASSPSANAADVTFEQCYAQNMGAAVSAGADSLTVRGLFNDGCITGMVGGQVNSTITHAMAKSTLALPFNGMLYSDGGPVNTNVCTRIIENCAIYARSGVPQIGLGTALFRRGSLTLRNCIIFCDSPSSTASLIRVQADAAFDLTVEYCVFVKLWALTSLWRSIDSVDTLTTLASDHNVWIGLANIDCTYQNTNYRTLANWQAQGFDANSVHLYTGTDRATVLANYFQGDPANGDFRLRSGLGTFGDGVSLNLAGPQEHWDWNARAVAAGAPSAWPTVPTSLADARTYIANPAAWDFYP